MKLEKLQQEIEDRRRVNLEDLEFVPFDWLAELLTQERILEVLEGENIEQYELPSIARDVARHGRRTFATLVLIGKPNLIYSFLKTNPGVNEGGPDTKLPLSPKELDEIFGTVNGSEAGSFWEKQFMFLVPTFPLGIPHRLFSENIRVPFLKSRTLPGSGGLNGKLPGGHFGSVTKEKLPPAKYGSADDQGMTLVRKELKTAGGDVYKGELRCLRLLNAIRHHSILELRGSFTKNTLHNFLFPDATGGDLHDLLEKDSRPPDFREDEAFYLALCGLASALEQLHYYSNDDLKLSLMGCHHDLKPRNVLVDGPRFILADFGLSRMTDNVKDLQTLAEDRDRYFDAPERFDWGKWPFVRQEIGQPSDIWSLGCIMAVVLAYMKGGPGEVKKFRDRREFIFEQDGIPSIIYKGFHKAGKPHEGVDNWLSGKNWLPETTQPLGVDSELVCLIRDMLVIKPAERPGIREVLRRLRCITLKKAAESTKDKLTKAATPRPPETLEYDVEGQVFLEWLERLDGSSEAAGRQFLRTDEMFAQVYRTVCDICQEFKLLADAAWDDSPLFARLRRLNDQLLECLDQGEQRSVRSVAELKIMPTLLQNTTSAGDTPGTENTSNQSRTDYNVRRLLSAVHVERLMKKSKNQIQKLDPKTVKFVEEQWGTESTAEEGPDGEESEEAKDWEIRTFRLGTLGEDSSFSPVIIEELEIMADYNDEHVSQTLFDSLERVLSIPPGEAVRFKALSCAGIYHDEPRRQIGLVYRYPGDASATSDSRPQVCALAEIFRQYPMHIDPPKGLFVSIDDRLRIAHELSTAVFEFHKIHWWHKNISSYNVLFFGECLESIRHTGVPFNEGDEDSQQQNRLPRKLRLGTPALIGFSHSRPDDAAFSNKMHAIDEALFAYRHPDYTGADAADGGKSSSYLAEYDYYGLGVVLLEIGLWCPLHKMVQNFRSMEKRAIRKALLDDCVPYLTATVGEAYANAVRACLSGELSAYGRRIDKGMVDEKFDILVLRQLDKLQRF